jgi:uncharacterized protein (DUF1697 family)
VTRIVTLLRAVNVGGRTVKMDRLRALFEEMGLTGVETFIASGNVLFDRPPAETAVALERRIEARLHSALVSEVAPFRRNGGEVAAAAACAPFEPLPPGIAASIYVGFLRAEPDGEARRKLEVLTSDADAFAVLGRELYWRSLKGMGQSPVSGTALERILGPMTTRNITTVRKLSEKAR